MQLPDWLLVQKAYHPEAEADIPTEWKFKGLFP